MRRSLVILAGLFLAVAARAGWTGDPTQSLKMGAVVMGYQSATRSVKSTSGGPTVDFDNRGFVLEARNALNPVVQLSIRALPFTGRMNLQDTSFNPHVAGGGVGLYLAPPEPLGPIHLGAAVVWDGAGGAQKREGSTKEYNRIFWSDTTLAAGASWSPIQWLGVYGGATYDSFRARMSVAYPPTPTYKVTLKETSPWGGYGGLTLAPNDAWFLTGEIRGGGERSLGVFLGYKY